MAVQWYTKKWICSNGIEERTKYPVRSEYVKGVRAERAASRGAARADNASRQAGRIMNENFKPSEDIHLALEYSDKELMAIEERAEKIPGEMCHEDKLFVAAQQNAANYIRRVQREMKRTHPGEEFLYLLITSDMNGKTGKMVRIHHHVIISANAKEAFIGKWRGFVLEKTLYTIHGDFSPLADYLIKQVRTVEGTKRYVPSRNMRQPKSTKPMLVTRYGDSEMRVPKGCVELYRSPYIKGTSQYLRYYRPRGETDDGNKV